RTRATARWATPARASAATTPSCSSSTSSAPADPRLWALGRATPGRARAVSLAAEHRLLAGQLVLPHDADRARHAAGAVVAVAAGVLVQVLLVVGLGGVERARVGRRPQLGRDVAVPVLAHDGVERLTARPHDRLVGRVGPVDRAAVLRADVVALPVRRR